MNLNNDKNLKQLFEKFFNAEQAGQMEQDLHKGEQLLRKYPAPEPDKGLIAQIKSKIAKVVLARRINIPSRTMYKSVLVAAVFIILAAVTAKLFQSANTNPGKLNTASIVPESIWDDNALSVLRADVEQVESDLLELQLGENDGRDQPDVSEMEIKLVEINNDFWKG